MTSNETQRIDYAALAPGAVKVLLGVEQYVRQSGLERSLLHLVKLRASYMNGCAYCVDMHTKEARADGERSSGSTRCRCGARRRSSRRASGPRSRGRKP